MTSARKRSNTKFKGFFETLRRGIRKAGDDVHAENDIVLKVHIAQDGDTGVWFVAASDVPGLRVEGKSADELIRKINDVAMELVELNLDEVNALVDARMGRRAKRVPAKSPPKPSRPAAHRPRTVIKPVFDSPLAVAC